MMKKTKPRSLINTIAFPRLYLLVCLIGGIVISVLAQNDSLYEFYVCENEKIIEKIEREHIPLNGDNVSMIPFRKGKLYGLVSKDNIKQWVVNPSYKDVFAVYPEGAIVEEYRAGYGLVNNLGKMIIQPYYQNLTKEGSIFHGIIEGVTLHKDTVLPEKFQDSYLNHYFDLSGKFLFEVSSHDHNTFIGDDSLAWFRHGKSFEIWSNTGRKVKQFRYSPDKLFLGISDNLLVFNESKEIIAYDIHGTKMFCLPLDEFPKGLSKLSNNLYASYDQDFRYFFYDSLGIRLSYFSDATANSVKQWTETYIYKRTDYLSEEYFVILDENIRAYGMINRSGDTVIPMIYNYVSPFINGYSFCYSSSELKSVLIPLDKNKEKVEINWDASSHEYHTRSIELPIALHDNFLLGYHHSFYDDEDGFVMESEGEIDSLTWLQFNREKDSLRSLDSSYFYYFDIEQNEKLRLPRNIKVAGNFSEGLAAVLIDNTGLGFVDKEGNFVIEPKYDIVAAGGYPIIYLVIPEFKGGYAYIKAWNGYIDSNGYEFFSGERVEDHYYFSH